MFQYGLTSNWLICNHLIIIIFVRIPNSSLYVQYFVCVILFSSAIINKSAHTTRNQSYFHFGEHTNKRQQACFSYFWLKICKLCCFAGWMFFFACLSIICLSIKFFFLIEVQEREKTIVVTKRFDICIPWTRKKHVDLKVITFQNIIYQIVDKKGFNNWMYWECLQVPKNWYEIFIILLM